MPTGNGAPGVPADLRIVMSMEVNETRGDNESVCVYRAIRQMNIEFRNGFPLRPLDCSPNQIGLGTPCILAGEISAVSPDCSGQQNPDTLLRRFS